MFDKVKEAFAFHPTLSPAARERERAKALFHEAFEYLDSTFQCSIFRESMESKINNAIDGFQMLDAIDDWEARADQLDALTNMVLATMEACIVRGLPFNEGLTVQVVDYVIRRGVRDSKTSPAIRELMLPENVTPL